MSRKDSRELFANVLGQQGEQPMAPEIKSASPHIMKVAAGVRQIQERGEALDRLLKDGDHILEIEPGEIVQSAIADRFAGEYEAAAIDEIVASMRERGQIVPGLVRPLAEGGYRIVFGRRRLAAARVLGIRFRAVVRELTDEQAIVFQGEENTNRNDLTFIEKCVFARAQEEAGYGREVICASLATGKSHVSEMLRIAATLPHEVLLAIGRSPDIGRRRWLAFAERWSGTRVMRERVLNALANAAPGSDRFDIAFTAQAGAPQEEARAGREPMEIRAQGFLVATVSWPSAGPRLQFSKGVPAGFVEFLGARMDALHEEYARQSGKDAPGPRE